jgi:hypothetical protein
MERQAYLRPSSASVWSKCAGYAALNAALGTEYVEETDNEIREDGTACHWLAVELWEGRQVRPGDLSPNGREITDEMFNAVEEYHALLQSWDGSDAVLEQQVPVSRYFPGVADGTPDAWKYIAAAATLHVGDLKFGFRPVEVWRNAQLIVYAWTLVCELTKQGHAPQQVVLTICQPRCAHRDGTTRSWIVSVGELAELAAKLAAAAATCYAPNPPCSTGPQCRDCMGAYACRTLQAAAGAGMEVSYDATPFELNEQQLGYELSKLMAARDHIDHRINGLSMQAESLLRKGKRVPAFELGRKATRWRWRPGAEALVRRMGELFGVEVMGEPRVKSVAKLRNAFPVDIQAMYGEKPDGELTLRMSDPNEAIRKMGSHRG